MSWWNNLLRRPPFSFIAGGLGLCLLLSAAMASAGDAPAPRPRRLGVVAFYNPHLLYVKYQQLVDYLTEATGEQWELGVTLDYEQTVRALCSGEIDLAYLGPFTYLQVREACGATPVVRLNTAGTSSYRSLIMVRQDSPFRSLTDLQGKLFAFGSPLSTSSHLVPRLMLSEAGLKPGEDIKCRYFGHHDRAARAVVLGQADACGVRDIVGENFARRGLRVLARSGPIPNFPLVLRPGAPEALRHSIIGALIERPANDPKIRKEMQSWDVELAGGFAPVADEDYEPVRVWVHQVFGPRALLDPQELLQCGGKG